MEKEDGLNMDNWKWQRNATDPRDDILCTCPAANDLSLNENRELDPFTAKKMQRDDCKVLPPIKRTTAGAANLKNAPKFSADDAFITVNGCTKINSTCYRALSDEHRHETVCSALKPRFIPRPRIRAVGRPGDPDNQYAEHARAGFVYWFDEKTERGVQYSCGRGAKKQSSKSSCK